MLLILTAVFKLWGFVAGLAIVLLVICTTKTVDGYTYLYPLVPFDKEALKGLLVRRTIRSREKSKNKNAISMKKN